MIVQVRAGESYSFSPSGSVRISSKHLANGPSGGHGTAAYPDTNLDAQNGISGIQIDGTGFLMGAFVGSGGAAPQYRSGMQFAVLRPAKNQAFYIGTGRYHAKPRVFVVPSGATRLVVGIPDGVNTRGCPGAYADNSGGFNVQIKRIG